MRGLYGTCADTIAAMLQQIPYFEGKNINMILVALPGFKQPQQLMSLNYFMALGAEYDLVINLDGFNEVALPHSDNLPFGVFPSFPRHWNVLARKAINTKVLHLLGKRTFEENLRESNRHWFSESIWRYSSFGLFMWGFMDNKKALKLYGLEQETRSAVKELGKDFQSVGPNITYGDTTQYFEHYGEIWKNTSAQMASLERTGSFKYFHFLQPNQYVSGSKTLTEKELEVAYEAGPLEYKTAVEKGYPELSTKSQELIEAKVKFFDLTMLYKDESRSVYADKCCHFNKLGYQLLAIRITSEIKQYYKEVDEKVFVP